MEAEHSSSASMVPFSLICFLFRPLFNFEESLHLLEQESNIFFNPRYFGDTIINGEWEKAENYVSAFARTGDSFFVKQDIPQDAGAEISRDNAQVKK
ncbi:hypothetical protein K1719_021983 [Acacia pycnantha]|nr:hypothetical protein K1719_021983 [Acacia pycnantha]